MIFVNTLQQVDCTAESELCGKYGVNGYPTLKIFRNGALSADYNGPREASKNSYRIYDI